MKIFKKSKKLASAPVPRALDEIKMAYSQLLVKLGENEYRIFVINEENARLNQAVLSLNQEAGARAELDKQNTEKTEAKNESK